MLSVIKSATMKVMEQQKLNLVVKGLMLRDSRLIADPHGKFRTPLIDFGRVVEKPDPEDAEPAEKLVPRQGLGARRWIFSSNEQVVAYHGKYYCPRMEQ